MATKTYIAKHDDGGTEVSVYVGSVLSDRYYIHAESGDNWRDAVEKGSHIREYHKEARDYAVWVLGGKH